MIIISFLPFDFGSKPLIGMFALNPFFYFANLLWGILLVLSVKFWMILVLAIGVLYILISLFWKLVSWKYPFLNKDIFVGSMIFILGFALILVGNYFTWYGCSDKFPADGFCFVYGSFFYVASLPILIAAMVMYGRGKHFEIKNSTRN
ncbi:hypothetical protein COV82_06380 [Candidatus Peregrinibacteria bacterium CG11_big_fil_rev_8_21_14_0_20_46_8]|nr:MAG: hypothetical protein COV82_06380 [Candidatus Peregrinibacteria bacterium CG11_big_fil_rev_8_21_14_0_20_46_8]